MTGVYARVRHPQYVGFILVMLGFLQWPTLLTLRYVSGAGGDVHSFG
jgi:protein-S-isoprenylcysteine O-methyltransferase Ste14